MTAETEKKKGKLAYVLEIILGVAMILGAIAGVGYKYFDGDPNTNPDLLEAKQEISAGVGNISEGVSGLKSDAGETK